MTVYADNAATTRMSRTALDAMLPAMEENYGNPSSPWPNRLSSCELTITITLAAA